MDDDDDPSFSRSDIQAWLRVEAEKVRIAADKRISAANKIADDCRSGLTTIEEANRLIDEHEARWGEVADDALLASEIHDNAVAEVYRLGLRPKSGRSLRSR